MTPERVGGLVDRLTATGSYDYVVSRVFPGAGDEPGVLELALVPTTRRIDLGRVRCTAPDGTPVDRVFVSECQVGLGGEVVRRMRPWHKRLGGTLGFGLAALGQALRQRA